MVQVDAEVKDAILCLSIITQTRHLLILMNIGILNLCLSYNIKF